MLTSMQKIRPIYGVELLLSLFVFDPFNPIALRTFLW